MKTILVVEDDTITREGLGVVLRREGYEILLAANGEEALASLRHASPDAILLDMLMPVLDGWHFLERLRTERPSFTFPILIFSGALTTLSRQWAADHGCVGFIRKPIDPEKMLEQIRRCLIPSNPEIPDGSRRAQRKIAERK
jgi:CheY-like chemotaxis protein